MDNLFLVKPSISYREGFGRYYEDYLALNAEDEQIYIEMYEKGKTDFEGYLQFLEERRKGIGVPEGWTATATYWLVNLEKEVLGVIRIRKDLCSDFLREVAGHIGYDICPSARGKGYGKEILALGLQTAVTQGLEKVLVVCSISNVPSRRIIESCGGVYDSDSAWEDGKVYSRYWIECRA